MYIIGKVLKPRGLKGELKVEIITSFPEHFQELEKLFVKNNSDWKAFVVKAVRLNNRFALVRLQGIDSQEQAETLRNHYLYIEEKDLRPLTKDEFYIHDLMNMQVVDENGTQLGHIVDVESYTGNDVYVLEGADGMKHLLPATKEVVKSVDPKQKKMVVRLMEGLWE